MSAELGEERPSWCRPRHPAFIVLTLLTAAYIAVVATDRFQHAFDPWRAETDTKQVTFQYYRYFVDGALPRGHLMTDYAAVYNSPPLFHAVMAPLSSVVDPLKAANCVNVVLWLTALLAIYLAVKTRTNHYVALAAAVLLARSGHFFRITAGGYARTFGPTLFLLFIAAWLSGRRRLCLVILVLQAGTYPSVMMPSALAFGVFTLWELFKTRDWRPVIELAFTAVIVVLLAKSQDLMAPEWWGSPVSYDDARENPAFFRGSRMPFVPHPPLAYWPWVYFESLFRETGHLVSTELTRFNREHYRVLILAPFGALVVLAIVRRVRFPLELIGLFVAAFLSFLLAREVAFKLHVPHRPIAHGWPYIIAVATPILCFLVFSSMLKTRQALATTLAVLFTLGPVMLTSGDGRGAPPTYRNYAKDAKLYVWLRENTPLDAVFAGNFQPLDEIPLFSWRIPYVNWKLAHPFRDGYWQEVTRRTREMYRAFYATDFAQVLRFAEQENVDYFVVDRKRFKALERGDGQLFEPLRSMVKPFFDECRRRGCVLDGAPQEAVVFRHRSYDVIDLAKLRDVVSRSGSARDGDR